MNGVHDMGGLQCFGDIEPDDGKNFHHEWERLVFALTLACGATGTWNLDNSRAARESLPPALYLSLDYYGIWLHALEKLLIHHQLITAEELHLGKSLQTPKTVNNCLTAEQVDKVLGSGNPVSRHVDQQPRFVVGDRVRVINQHPTTHTRLPNYIRNHTGVVHRIHGAHIFPDSHTVGAGENPQWLYNISFDSSELWGHGPTATGQIHVDCWEPYLEPESRHAKA
jgi:nitrile hydratase